LPQVAFRSPPTETFTQTINKCFLHDILSPILNISKEKNNQEVVLFLLIFYDTSTSYFFLYDK
jgi:hypothetical protein